MIVIAIIAAVQAAINRAEFPQLSDCTYTELCCENALKSTDWYKSLPSNSPLRTTLPVSSWVTSTDVESSQSAVFECRDNRDLSPGMNTFLILPQLLICDEDSFLVETKHIHPAKPKGRKQLRNEDVVQINAFCVPHDAHQTKTIRTFGNACSYVDVPDPIPEDTMFLAWITDANTPNWSVGQFPRVSYMYVANVESYWSFSLSYLGRFYTVSSVAMRDLSCFDKHILVCANKEFHFFTQPALVLHSAFVRPTFG